MQQEAALHLCLQGCSDNILELADGWRSRILSRLLDRTVCAAKRACRLAGLRGSSCKPLLPGRRQLTQCLPACWSDCRSSGLLQPTCAFGLHAFRREPAGRLRPSQAGCHLPLLCTCFHASIMCRSSNEHDNALKKGCPCLDGTEGCKACSVPEHMVR